MRGASFGRDTVVEKAFAIKDATLGMEWAVGYRDDVRLQPSVLERASVAQGNGKSVIR